MTLVPLYPYFYIIFYMSIGSDVSLLLYYILHENGLRYIPTFVVYFA